MATKSETVSNAPGAELRFKGRELTRAARGVERDLLGVLLEPKKMYTEKEAKEILAMAMAKGVNADAGR